MSIRNQSIQSLFTEVCDSAYWNGYLRISRHHMGCRPSAEHIKPGYYYNQLPDWIKERLKNELTSDIAKNVVLRLFLEAGPNEPWWDHKAESERFFRREKKKFEAELMKHGWQPNYKL